MNLGGSTPLRTLTLSALAYPTCWTLLCSCSCTLFKYPRPMGDTYIFALWFTSNLAFAQAPLLSPTVRLCILRRFFKQNAVPQSTRNRVSHHWSQRSDLWMFVCKSFYKPFTLTADKVCLYWNVSEAEKDSYVPKTDSKYVLSCEYKGFKRSLVSWVRQQQYVQVFQGHSPVPS